MNADENNNTRCDPGVPSIEAHVSRRYAAGAECRETELCCPVSYDPRLLKVIPDEVLKRDYGCGDPSRWVSKGQHVLDLGSGGGKICFIASQIVGSSGSVTGVDMTDEMLELAKSAATLVGERLGYHNVRFLKGRIQDLRLDRDWLDRRLARKPPANETEYAALQDEIEKQQADNPLVADNSIDTVVSNCVLNLVRPGHKAELFSEIHRVLRPGGRAVVSDIVADTDVPRAMQQDAELWSGCISGALRGDRFLQAFNDAGLIEVKIVEQADKPWRVEQGIAFSSVTVTASKKTGADNNSTATGSCC